ncbi:MAG TPA: ATP-binding protein [Galbitalea sp.]
MSLDPSQQIGRQMINRGFFRFAHVVGYLCIAAAIVDVVGYQLAAPSVLIWHAIFPLVLALAALVLLDRFRTTGYAIAFLAIGGVSQYWFAVTLLSHEHSLYANNLAISLVNVALIMVGGSGFVARTNILWSLLGFAVGQAASITAGLQVGADYHVDEVAIEVEIGLIAVLATVGLTRSRRLSARPQLEKAAFDDEVSDLRYRIEVQAAALMHDTVLGHLDAIAKSSVGDLPPDLARDLERDLEVLIGEEWLSDPSPELDARARTEWRASSVFAAVQEARDQSLNVDVSGDLTAVTRLDAERDTAAGLAVRQCLVNVLRHAQVESAEVVIIGGEHEVSIMVIDSGRGFSEEKVGVDRLGIRQSVRKRIEAVGGGVNLWSTPGRGTSIMLRLPAVRSVDDSLVEDTSGARDG